MFIPVTEFQLAKYKDNPEDKALVGVLLKVLNMGSNNDDKPSLGFLHKATMDRALLANTTLAKDSTITYSCLQMC